MNLKEVQYRFQNFVLRNLSIEPCTCRPSKYRKPNFVFPVFRATDENGKPNGWLLECPDDEHFIKLSEACDPKLELCTECFGITRSDCECFRHKIVTTRPTKFKQPQY